MRLFGLKSSSNLKVEAFVERKRWYQIVIVGVLISCNWLLVPVLSQPNQKAEVAEEIEFTPNQVLVRFASHENGRAYDFKEKRRILRDFNSKARIKRNLWLVPGLCLVELPKDLSVLEAVKILNQRKDVLYAEPNYRIYLNSTPNDSYFNQQWNLHNTGQSGGTNDADIDAPEAWDVISGSNVIVAVLDTGVDYTHPDLSGNIWINTSEQTGDGNSDGRPGVANVDDDGDGLIDEDSNNLEPGDPDYTNDLVNDDDENGYEDDIYGYDFSVDHNSIDPSYHGTHVAGIIGAAGNNSQGVTGVCWGVPIMNLKVFSANPEDSDISSAADAMYYAIINGAKILNCSWNKGRGIAQSVIDAIDQVEASGGLVVNSSGNSSIDIGNTSIYPSVDDANCLIVVMATNRYDQRWSGSNYGAVSVDLAAPGADILSTMPTYETSTMQAHSLSTYYDTDSGTSMAAPHVSAACALVWSANPSLSAMEVKQIIMGSVDRLTSLSGKCVTEGRLNLNNALSCATDTPVLTFKNSTEEDVAWFGQNGNLFLSGTLTENTTPQSSVGDEFRVQDSTNNDVAIIDLTTGNMTISGVLSEGQEDLSAATHCIIKDNSGSTIGYIDTDGDFYLKGHLVENMEL